MSGGTRSCLEGITAGTVKHHRTLHICSPSEDLIEKMVRHLEIATPTHSHTLSLLVRTLDWLVQLSNAMPKVKPDLNNRSQKGFYLKSHSFCTKQKKYFQIWNFVPFLGPTRFLYNVQILYSYPYLSPGYKNMYTFEPKYACRLKILHLNYYIKKKKKKTGSPKVTYRLKSSTCDQLGIFFHSGC